MIHPAVRIICLWGILLLTCAGCVRTGTAPRVAAPIPLAESLWTGFIRNSDGAGVVGGAFRANANLYYAGKEGSQRVSAYFWANGHQEPPYIFRLDIQAGIGNTVAKIYEDPQNFVAYVPAEESAYYQTGAGANLLAFGVPLPFSLADLALLVTGRYTDFFLGGTVVEQPEQAFIENDAALLFILDGRARLPGQLIISRDGLPLAWSEQGDDGWNLTIEYWPDSTRLTPQKMSFTHGSGAEATVILRELTRPATPFAPEDLQLKLPPTTRLLPLQER